MLMKNRKIGLKALNIIKRLSNFNGDEYLYRNQPFKTYYPTSVTITGYNIIELSKEKDYIPSKIRFCDLCNQNEIIIGTKAYPAWAFKII
jgi:hypothetical protein